MDAVKLNGRDRVRRQQSYTKDNDSLGCAKLVSILQCTG